MMMDQGPLPFRPARGYFEGPPIAGTVRQCALGRRWRQITILPARGTPSTNWRLPAHAAGHHDAGRLRTTLAQR